MRLLTFSVSLRQDSFNTKLIKICNTFLENNNIEFETLDLNDYLMPYYNMDIQDNDGFPTSANKLKEKFEKTDGFIIASPEYNYTMPGHFKNTFDWISRFRPMPWSGKSVLLMSASSALGGGNRGLLSLRVPFEATGAVVSPDMFSLPNAREAFDDENLLVDQDLNKRFTDGLHSFLSFCKHQL